MLIKRCTLLLCLALAGCVAPSDQQSLMAGAAEAWHFKPQEQWYGRLNMVLDTRSRILVVTSQSDPYLMQQGVKTGDKVNQVFARQTYAHLRQWFAASQLIDQPAMSRAQALEQARHLQMQYLITPEVELWDDQSGFGLEKHWPGAGGTDHLAAVISLLDVHSGAVIEAWEIRGRSGQLSRFSDAPSRLVSSALDEWSRYLSGQSEQSRSTLTWF